MRGGVDSADADAAVDARTDVDADADSDTDTDADEDEDEDEGTDDEKLKKKTGFHLPSNYSSQQLSSTEYIEHTGNEAQVGECAYFSGGMFVTPKSTEAAAVVSKSA